MKKQAAKNRRTKQRAHRVVRKSQKASKPVVAEPAKAERATETSTVVLLLQREGGATLQELMDATGWQAHSVRGFLSGTLRKKHGLVVTLGERENNQRAYHLDTQPVVAG